MAVLLQRSNTIERDTVSRGMAEGPDQGKTITHSRQEKGNGEDLDLDLEACLSVFAACVKSLS